MDFEQWIGRQESRLDTVQASAFSRLAATLGHEEPPWMVGEVPPLGHWLLHLPETPQDALGEDGHPMRGGFMPPVPLPRRMWVGSRVQMISRIPFNAEVVRRSTIRNVAIKGLGDREFVLVTIRHEILCGDRLSVDEEQDIAYMRPRPYAGEPAEQRVTAPKATCTRRIEATPELLFRFSALTFNAHRIHYDHRYAREMESYPGLVVQGPLLATLLLDLFLRQAPQAPIMRFSFRAHAPLFAEAPFDLCLAPTSSGANLWVSGSDGQLKMTASLERDRA